VTGAGASEQETTEDTSPQDRALRAGAGLTAGLLGARLLGGRGREGMGPHTLPLPGELGARPSPPPMSVPGLVSWARYNAMLSGPSGRIQDVVSPGLGRAGYPRERPAAVPFDIAQTRLLGGERSIYGRQVPAEVSG